nr:outer membrane protein OmpK [uncultured Albidiferax sp.]
MAMYKFLTALAAVAALAPAAHADDNWSFKNVGVNYLDWTDRTLDNTGKGPFGQKKSFTYLELEGGMGGKWGDVYGFFDLENPSKSSNNSDSAMDRRYAMKGVAHINMTQVGGMPVQLYGHIYNFMDNGFRDQNNVLGLSTAYFNGGFWIKPFFGAHYETKTDLGTQYNGTMGGWVFGYSFKAMDQSFMVSSWHETEMGRKSGYLQMARDGGVVTANKTAQNGALSLWWNATPSITTGITYRYAKNKLGSATYQDALIYTAKYNF